MKVRGNHLICLFFQVHRDLVFSENSFFFYKLLQKLASAYLQASFSLFEKGSYSKFWKQYQFFFEISSCVLPNLGKCSGAYRWVNFMQLILSHLFCVYKIFKLQILFLNNHFILVLYTPPCCPFKNVPKP